MAGAHTLTNDVDLDMTGMFAQLWRSKWLILIVTGIAGALLYLVSDAGGNVNGAAISVDGGWTAK